MVDLAQIGVGMEQVISAVVCPAYLQTSSENAAHDSPMEMPTEQVSSARWK